MATLILILYLLLKLSLTFIWSHWSREDSKATGFYVFNWFLKLKNHSEQNLHYLHLIDLELLYCLKLLHEHLRNCALWYCWYILSAACCSENEGRSRFFSVLRTVCCPFGLLSCSLSDTLSTSHCSAILPTDACPPPLWWSRERKSLTVRVTHQLQKGSWKSPLNSETIPEIVKPTCHIKRFCMEAQQLNQDLIYKPFIDVIMMSHVC